MEKIEDCLKLKGTQDCSTQPITWDSCGKNLSSFTTPTKPTLRRNVSGTQKNLTAKLGYVCRLRRIEGDPTKIHSTSRMGFLHKQFMPKIELAELETSKFHIQKLATPRLASVMPIAPN